MGTKRRHHQTGLESVSGQRNGAIRGFDKVRCPRLLVILETRYARRVLAPPRRERGFAPESQRDGPGEVSGHASARASGRPRLLKISARKMSVALVPCERWGSSVRCDARVYDDLRYDPPDQKSLFRASLSSADKRDEPATSSQRRCIPICPTCQLRSTSRSPTRTSTIIRKA